MSGLASSLAGKVSIITGASSGLGRAIALAFSKHGATVVCADREASSQGRDQPTDELIQLRGGRSLFVPTDVTKADEVRELVRAAAYKFGRVDVMVNNAGIAPEASSPRPVNETSDEVFDATWQVNARGVFLGCKYAGQQMLTQPRLPGHHNAGSIINLSSVLGVLGLSVSMDYAPHGIQCNSILPGFTRTPMIASMSEDREVEQTLIECHPLQRLGDPEEIANVAVFLASDYASGITGVNLSVDGGLHAQLRLK